MNQNDTGKIGDEDMDKTNNNTEKSSTRMEDEQVITNVYKEIAVTQELSSDSHESLSEEEDDSIDSNYVEDDNYVEEEGEDLINVQETVTQDGKI